MTIHQGRLLHPATKRSRIEAEARHRAEGAPSDECAAGVKHLHDGPGAHRPWATEPGDWLSRLPADALARLVAKDADALEDDEYPYPPTPRPVRDTAWTYPEQPCHERDCAGPECHRDYCAAYWAKRPAAVALTEALRVGTPWRASRPGRTGRRSHDHVPDRGRPDR